MSSGSGQMVGSSKAIANTSNLSSSLASFQAAPSPTDGGAQRRPGGTGSFGAGSISRNSASARNNQGRKNKHKKHTRPSLVNEDAEAESVSGILQYYLLKILLAHLRLMFPGHNEVNH